MDVKNNKIRTKANLQFDDVELNFGDSGRGDRVVVLWVWWRWGNVNTALWVEFFVSIVGFW